MVWYPISNERSQQRLPLTYYKYPKVKYKHFHRSHKPTSPFCPRPIWSRPKFKVHLCLFIIVTWWRFTFAVGGSDSLSDQNRYQTLLFIYTFSFRWDSNSLTHLHNTSLNSWPTAPNKVSNYLMTEKQTLVRQWMLQNKPWACFRGRVCTWSP